MRQQREQQMIGESPPFLEVLEQVSRIAPLDRPVLVIGERGTGKELIAARIHYLSRRWEQAFVKLNCAALAESLLETELFGHEAGSFTGANAQRLGRFELADSGSLFLDELASTSSRVQEKILRVVEYGELERVGGTQTLKTDVRIIGATHEDLPKLADEGKFRPDLLDRLAFDVITLPPLRHRAEDIMGLAEHFAVKMTGDLGRTHFAGFSGAAKERLRAYTWPGNVRELKNVIERAVYACDPEMEIEDIVFDPFASPWRPGNSLSADEIAPVTQGPFDFKAHVRDEEVRLLKNALENNRFNQKKTAEYLGMTYHQLRGYLRKYELTETET